MNKTEKDNIYRNRWKQLYQSKQSSTYLTCSVDEIKLRQQGSHYLLYNKSRKSRKLSKEPTEYKVSQPFDKTKFNYSQVFNKQILFYLDLDNQNIVESSEVDTGGLYMKCPQGIHPVIMNISPLYLYQSLLAVYPNDERPQLITENILHQVLKIYKIFPDIKIGYNSVGCGSVNHLHFHLLYSEPILEKLPIETAEQKPWLKLYLNKATQNFNVQVNQINHQNSCIFVIKPMRTQQLTYSQTRRQMTLVFDAISKEAIELNLPYNLYIADKGQTIYMMIRDFDDRYGWLEYCGVIVVGEGQFQMTEEEIMERKRKLKIKQQLRGELRSRVESSLQRFL